MERFLNTGPMKVKLPVMQYFGKVPKYSFCIVKFIVKRASNLTLKASGMYDLSSALRTRFPVAHF